MSRCPHSRVIHGPGIEDQLVAMLGLERDRSVEAWRMLVAGTRPERRSEPIQRHDSTYLRAALGQPLADGSQRLADEELLVQIFAIDRAPRSCSTSCTGRTGPGSPGWRPRTCRRRA